MPTDVFIYSNLPLSCGRDEIEDAVDDVMRGNGEATGGGAATSGWNVDLELTSEADADQHVAAIVFALRQLGVPDDTYLCVGADQLRVNVYSRDP